MNARWDMELPLWMFAADGRFLGRSFTMSVGEDGLYTVLPGATPLRVGDCVDVRLIVSSPGTEGVRVSAKAVVRKRETLLGEDSEDSGLDLEFACPLPGPWNAAVAPAA